MKSYKPRHVANATFHANRSEIQDERNSVYSQQFYSQPKAHSEEVFSHSQSPSMAGSQYAQTTRQNSEYLYQARGRSGRYDNTMPFARGRGKADLGKEPGNMTPYYSSDSGYDSAGAQSAMNSRAPSLQTLQDPRSQYNSRASHSFVPELRLGQEPTEQMSELERILTGDAATTSQEGILKNVGNVSALDHEHDVNSTKSSKPKVPGNKKTRFEDQSDPVPVVDHLQNQRELLSVAPVKSLVQHYDAAASKEYMTAPANRTELPRHGQQDHPHNSAQSLELPPQTFGGLHLACQPKENASDGQALLDTTHLIPATMTSRRPSLPPLSTLDGLKVNKKGRILDEEGDQIGELVEGDLLDCVRQKVNEKGEVLDEYGRVVGIVRTIPNNGEASASPAHPAPQHIEPRPEAATQSLQPSGPDLSLYTGSVPHPIQHTGPHTDAVQPQHHHHAPPHFASSHVSEAPASIASDPTTVQHSSIVAGSRPSGSASPLLQGARPVSPLDNADSKAQVAMSTDGPHYSAPLTPKDQSSHELLQRPTRTASERSLSELGRSYARPPMNPVPEDNVPEDDIMPVESADLFAYKGEIPLTDARLPSRTIDLSLSRTAFSGGPSPPTMPGQLSPSARIPMASRRATTHFTGGYSSNNLNPKLAMMNNSRRSPFSSHGKLTS